MEKEDLPGYKKKSFVMAFGGGEIWFEHLDSLYEHSDWVIEKLRKDYEVFRRPSLTSLIAVNLDETVINDAIIEELTRVFVNGSKQFRKIVFVGIPKPDQKKIDKRMWGHGFLYAFIDDFEKAKEWLM